MSDPSSITTVLAALEVPGADKRQLFQTAIKLLKKFIYTEGHRLGVLSPPHESLDPFLLATGMEFEQLIDALTDEPGIVPGVHLGKLIVFRRFDVARRGGGQAALASGVRLTWKPSALEWGHAAVDADDVLNELDTRLEMPSQMTTKTKKYLTSWREIVVALDLKNNDTDRAKVRRLNQQYEGPIVFPGQGGQPQVSYDKLMSWWYGVEARLEELRQRHADTQVKEAG